MRVAVALGGNALLKRGEPMTAEVRRENVRQAAPAPAADANEHQYHEIAGGGHCANLDRPDETNAVVVDFLARHLGGQSPGSGPAG